MFEASSQQSIEGTCNFNFIVFSSLAFIYLVIQFLMELQKSQFWICKGQSLIIKFANECKTDDWILLFNTGLRTQNFQRIYEPIGTFDTQKYCSSDRQ